MNRAPALERALLCGGIPTGRRDAARQLVDLAHARALPGPVNVAYGRHLGVEYNEELADAANYLVWRLRAGRITRARFDAAAAALVEAWNAVNG